MNEMITVELDEATMAALVRQATAHGRTPAEEIQNIVRRDCAPSADRDVFLRRAAQSVHKEAGGPFDRTTFLQRARELAMKSRSLQPGEVAPRPRGES